MIEQDYGIDVLALKKDDRDAEGEEKVNDQIEKKRENNRVLRKKELPSNVTIDEFLEQ